MGESLMERRRVQEEGLRIVNCFLFRESLMHLTVFGATDLYRLKLIYTDKNIRINQSKSVLINECNRA